MARKWCSAALMQFKSCAASRHQSKQIGVRGKPRRADDMRSGP